jgi:hypothetical protein
MQVDSLLAQGVMCVHSTATHFKVGALAAGRGWHRCTQVLSQTFASALTACLCCVPVLRLQRHDCVQAGA